MEFLNVAIPETRIYEWEVLLDNWVFLAMSGFLLFELVRLALRKALSRNLIGDTVTNFVTLFAFIGIAYVMLGAFYVGTYYFVYEYFRVLTIPITPWSIALCVVLADLAYYFEHRFTHRVHHGSNPCYIDKNYGGIFIVWDRLFGTFAEEREPVVYGITTPLNTVNPFVVFFHGFARLGRQMWTARGVGAKLGHLVRPPG